MKWPLVKINKLRLVSFIYWVFLTYMIAAFVWWYVSLEKQNDEIAAVKFQSIQLSDPALEQKVIQIQNFQLRKTKQFIGEGLTFLFLFLWGAIYVYRSLLKQLRYSNQQQNFMMAVTHELKTPIAISHLNIETLLKRDLDTAQQNKLLEATLKETKRLDALSNNILLASQLDMGQYESNQQELDLSKLVKEACQSFQERFPLRLLDTFIEASIFIQGEALLIQMLVNNLLDNANKYSPTHTPIAVHLQREQQKLILTIKDLGVGIPVHDQEKIFEKFYRVGAESTRSSKGTGLGLYLCKKITAFHNASLQVKSNEGQGSIFTVTFANQ
ncbi:MAG: ATP-binding protein [Bacteroidetes bacterium]|nr:ATP-binding protein [Bacteroidota bacterium]